MDNCYIYTGNVIKYENSKVFVRIDSSGNCAKCHAKGGCGEQSEKIIECNTIETFNPGDQVRVELKRELGKIAVFYLFIIPLIVVVAGFFIAHYFLKNESLAGLFSIVLLSIYYYGLYLIKKSFEKKYQIKVIKSGD